MQNPDSAPQDRPESFEKIAADLQALREIAGHVSYAELVRRITDLRVHRGVPAVAAIPARSTVYNAFKSSRSRMDTELLRDIVLALGECEEEAARWVRRAGEAQRLKTQDAAAAALAVLDSQAFPVPDHRKPSMLPFILLLLGLVVLNHGSHWFLAASLDLPIYLDMIGTAVASLAFGPRYGVAVAIATGLTGPLFEPGILPFVLVNITGALIWAYGVRRFRLGRDILSFFFLNLVVATACSLVATPILIIVRGGAYGSMGRIAESLQDAGIPFLVATFTSNMSTSILDKLLTGFIAIAIFAALHSRMGLSAKHMPLVEKLGELREAQPGARVVFAQA